LIFDSLIEELKLTPLKVAYWKGWKALERENTSKLVIVKKHKACFVELYLSFGSMD
jgi:hypothetical protein